MVSFDRLLSHERRCDAYSAAIDRTISQGARTFAILGIGSMLPALHAARRGAIVAVVEPSEGLAKLARDVAAANGANIVVVSRMPMLRQAWGATADVFVTERIDEGLCAMRRLPLDNEPSPGGSLGSSRLAV